MTLTSDQEELIRLHQMYDMIAKTIFTVVSYFLEGSQAIQSMPINECTPSGSI